MAGQAESYLRIEDDNSDNFIGSFNGYVRRPQPSSKGLQACFYGENGDDADSMLALSITEFQNLHVIVSVYWVKDAIGLVKKEDAGYPLISSFDAFIQRSKPRSTGMIAMLFAPNGESSDSANELGTSKYLDSFVHVRLQQFSEIIGEDSQKQLFLSKDIVLPYTNPTPKKHGEFKDAYKSLQIHGFFREPKVWHALGGEESYKQWLKDRACSAAIEPNCCEVGNPIKIPNCSFDEFTEIPLCEKHAFDSLNDINLIGGKYLLENQRSILVASWATEMMCQEFKVTTVSEIRPHSILEWCTNKQIQDFLPKRYLNYIND